MQEGNGNVAGAAPAAALPAASPAPLKMEDIIQNLQAYVNQSDAACAHQLQVKDKTIDEQCRELVKLRPEATEVKRKLFAKTKEAEEMVLCSVFLLPCDACVCSLCFVC